MASRLTNFLHFRNWRAAYFKITHEKPGLMHLRYCTVVDGYDKDKGNDGDDHAVEVDKGLEPGGIEPDQGWNFRGVYKAIICGKVGQTPTQKLLRNGRTITIFTVGTAGMHDQRSKLINQSSRPLQWHRIVVHNLSLGGYAINHIVRNALVYVEGDIETRKYTDSINGTERMVPEICVRQGGKLKLMKKPTQIDDITLDGLSMV